MKNTFSVDDLRSNDFAWWLILEAVSQLHNADKIISAGEGGRHTICLTLNGFELPMLDTLVEIDKQLDKLVEKRALELLDERVGDALETMRDTASALKERLTKAD